MTGEGDLEQRITRLERAVEALSARLESRPVAAVSDPEDGDDTFWALNGLAERHPEGAILLAGLLDVPETGPVRWQYGLNAHNLLEQDWTELAGALDALGNPVRLTLLQLVLSGVRGTSELAAQESLGTTGQVHHHLRALLAAGWLQSTGRGRYEVPATRVVPLLVILLAARRT